MSHRLLAAILTPALAKSADSLVPDWKWDTNLIHLRKILSIQPNLIYHSRMANMKLYPRLRQFDDDTEDLRSYRGRSGFGPTFDTELDCNGVSIDTNAHDERGYEDMRRLPDQRTRVENYDADGRYVDTKTVLSDPPMSVRVKNQVLNSIASRVGTMTSDSLLDRSRGVGHEGADGGLSERTSWRPSDLYNRNNRGRF